MCVEKKLAKALEHSAAVHKVIIEKITVSSGNSPTVEVTVDNPHGVAESPSARLLAEVSHEFARVIEKQDLFQRSYVVQVSSPGVERRFAEDRHWEKAVGRLVRLTLIDGGDIVARLDRFDALARQIVVRQQIPARKGYPVRYDEARTISLKDVKQARAEVEL